MSTDRNFRDASLANIPNWLHVDCSACRRPISGCHTDSTCAIKGAMCGIRAIEELAKSRPQPAPAATSCPACGLARCEDQGVCDGVIFSRKKAEERAKLEIPASPVVTNEMVYAAMEGYGKVTNASLISPRAMCAALSAALQAQAGDGWIACSERMPEKDTEALIWVPQCYGLEHADWNGKTWNTHRGAAKFGTREVTHWRHLPEAPSLSPKPPAQANGGIHPGISKGEKHEEA